MKGLNLEQQVSSEIMLKYKAVPGMTIYLIECLWSQAWMNVTGWNPNPKYNSGQIQSDGRVSVILVGHWLKGVTLSGDVTAEAEVDSGDSAEH